MGVSKKNNATPKMDGENHGTPYEQMDDLGGVSTPYFWFNTQIAPEVKGCVLGGIKIPPAREVALVVQVGFG